MPGLRCTFGGMVTIKGFQGLRDNGENAVGISRPDLGAAVTIRTAASQSSLTAGGDAASLILSGEDTTAVTNYGLAASSTQLGKVRDVAGTLDSLLGSISSLASSLTFTPNASVSSALSGEIRALTSQFNSLRGTIGGGYTSTDLASLQSAVAQSSSSLIVYS